VWHQGFVDSIDLKKLRITRLHSIREKREADQFGKGKVFDAFTSIQVCGESI
tara:strand:- start:382 stop:537 length:156 start_codon:yes stop_codon:yes gene_type:complete